MVRRTAAAAATCVVLALAGCGGGSPGRVDSDTEDGGQQPAASGQTLWMTVRDNSYLTGVDTGTGESVVEPIRLGDFGTDVEELMHVDGKVWLSLDDGKVLVFDAKGTQVKTLTFDTGDYGIATMAADKANVYVAYGAKGGKPVLARVDAGTYETKATASVIGDIHNYSGLVVDGGTLWVLQGNGFRLIKVDSSTLAVQGSVPLGRDPKDPTGPFKDLYGYGEMVQAGGNIWIVDTYSHVLIRVDKATMTATRVADLNGLVTNDTAVRVVSRADDFFLAVSSDDAAKVVRYDGKTGQPAHTYEFGPGAARGISVAGDRMYVTSDEYGTTVLQVDVGSGKTLRTYEYAGAARLAVAA